MGQPFRLPGAAKTVCLVLLLGVSLRLSVATSDEERNESPLGDGDLSDRAGLLFRSLDKDADRVISADDIMQSQDDLRLHMPGVSTKEFLTFLQHADRDGDLRLSREELFQGIASGLSYHARASKSEENSPTHVLSPTDFAMENELLPEPTDVEERYSATDAGVLIETKSEQVPTKKAPKEKPRIDYSQDTCIMCQYIVEQCEVEAINQGLLPGHHSLLPSNHHVGAPEDGPVDVSAAMDLGAAAEAHTRGFPLRGAKHGHFFPPVDAGYLTVPLSFPAFVETNAAAQQVDYGFQAAGTRDVDFSRQATRVQRQGERSKYNNIYRVVDLTLDRVCEQAMPPRYYGYCKQVYATQADVIDGLRYNYRPSDICMRNGMCPTLSYLQWGRHSRYAVLHEKPTSF